jgi:hypothetical protein
VAEAAHPTRPRCLGGLGLQHGYQLLHRFQRGAQLVGAHGVADAIALLLKAQRRVSGVDRTGNHVTEGVAGEGWARGLVADTRRIRFPEVFTEAESVMLDEP